MMQPCQLWNKKELKPPSKQSYKLPDDKPRITVQRLLSLCNNIEEAMNGLGSLNMEGAAISRLIYRIKGRLRLDKGLQAMLKINRCLIQYLNLNICNELSFIREPLSDDKGPSQQMMQWYLVRLQGLAKLFHRIYNTCVEAAEYLTLRIKTGHLWPVVLIALAVVSRIWTISQYMLQSICSWYIDLYIFMDKLKPSPEQWLPDSYVLPKDLVKFLGEPSYLVKKQSGIPDSAVFSHLTKDGNMTEEDSFVKSDDNDTLNCLFGLNEDMGEQISRDQVNTQKDVNGLNRKRKYFEIEAISTEGNTVIKKESISKKRKKKKPKQQKNEKRGAETVSSVATEEISMKDNTVVEELIRKKKNKKKKPKNQKVAKEDNKIVSSNTKGGKINENIVKNESLSIKKRSINVPMKNFNNSEGKSLNKHIDGIQSYGDLLKFIKIEQKKRTETTLSQNIVTKNLDKLQFRMFSNFINKYLTRLKNVSNKEKLNNMLDKLHTEMYTYLAS